MTSLYNIKNSINQIKKRCTQKSPIGVIIPKIYILFIIMKSVGKVFFPV